MFFQNAIESCFLVSMSFWVGGQIAVHTEELVNHLPSTPIHLYMEWQSSTSCLKTFLPNNTELIFLKLNLVLFEPASYFQSVESGFWSYPILGAPPNPGRMFYKKEPPSNAQPGKETQEIGGEGERNCGRLVTTLKLGENKENYRRRTCSLL